jgi:hypothetical protein
VLLCIFQWKSLHNTCNFLVHSCLVRCFVVPSQQYSIHHNLNFLWYASKHSPIVVWTVICGTVMCTPISPSTLPGHPYGWI